MSYWDLAATSQEYRSLPSENHPLERLSQLANLLNSLVLRRMVGLYSAEDEGPPYALDGYGQGGHGAHWTSAANAAELNAAGIPYYVESGSEASSASRSAATRPRALTNSSPENPRASKRRANIPLQDDGGRTSTSAVSELATTYSYAHGSGMGPRFGREDGGRIQLPPMHFPLGPVNSPAMTNQSLPSLRYALPPLDFDDGSSARARSGPSSIYSATPSAPTLATARPLPVLRSPAAPRLPTVVDSVASPSLFPLTPPTPRRSVNNPSLFDTYPATNPPLLVNQNPSVGNTRSFTRSAPSNSRAPAGAFTPSHFNVPSPYDIDPDMVTNLAEDPNWGTAPVNYGLSKLASYDRSARAGVSSRASREIHARVAPTPQPGTTSGAMRPSQPHTAEWPFTQTTYTSDQRKAPAPQPIKTGRIPSPKLDDDVIDLTSSSPPDMATLFESVRVKRSPAPLIKQESFPEFFFIDQVESESELELEPETEPEVPIPATRELSVVRQPAPPEPSTPLPPCGYDIRKYPWATFPGGPIKYLSPAARGQLFATARSNHRWLMSEDMLIIEALFPSDFTLAAKKKLRQALMATEKAGGKSSYSKPALELSVGAFQSARLPSAVYGRIRYLCTLWQIINVFVAVIGGNIDFTLPEVDLISHFNNEIAAHRSREPLLKALHGWTVIVNCKSDPGVKSVQVRMAQYLQGHPSYDPVVYRSGRTANVGSAAAVLVAFWTSSGELGSDSGVSGVGSVSAQSAAGLTTPNVAVITPRAPATITSKAQSGKGKGRAIPEAEHGPVDNSAVEGSVSSLPSAPSSVSERASTTSTPATTLDPINSGFIVPRQPVPPRTGNRTTAGGRSTTGSLATHSPKDVSQASKLELLREVRSAGEQGTSESAWLIRREQEMLKEARLKEHDLKARQVKIQEAQANADIALKNQKQLVDLCLQVQSSPNATATSLSRVGNILDATLDAAAAAANLNIRPSSAGASSGLVLQSRAGQPVSSPRRSHRSPSVHSQRQLSQTPGAGPSSRAEVSRLLPSRSGLNSNLGTYHEDEDIDNKNPVQPWDF